MNKPIAGTGTKSKVRAKVEHVFRILKRVFGFTKVRYRGLFKNHQWLCAAFALVICTCTANDWPRLGRSVSAGRKRPAERQNHTHPPNFSSKTDQKKAALPPERSAFKKSGTCAVVP